MEFAAPLIPGRLLRRYKRFFADVELADGSVAVAHCPNPGAMTGFTAPGLAVHLSRATNPKRKLAYSWELADLGGTLVGINTGHPNGIAAEALAAGLVPELAGYGALRREVRYGQNSRIDILLEDGAKPPCYVEVKNVHLVRTPGLAEFPDSVTARGAKHLAELTEMAAQGARAVMLYVVQRGDCDRLSVAEDIDPKYAAALRAALERGVEAICYDCTVAMHGIELRQRLPVAL